MKRRGDELYEAIRSRENVECALYNAARGVRRRPAVQKCLDNAGDVVSDICRMLERGDFRTGTYRPRTIFEPKLRHIHILPFFPDRIVQHALVDVVAPAVWEPSFIFDSYACRKGKGQTRGVLRTAQFVRRHAFDFGYDIRSFYHSIDHGVLKSLIERRIKGARTLGLCFDIIDSWQDAPGRGCPIGNLTSQWFGNVYMNALDHYAKEELGIKAYVRYCDDFHVFGDDRSEMRWFDTCIAAFVRDELHLDFSKRNLARTKDGCDFLGYRIFPEKILVRKSTAKRIRRRMDGLRRILDRDARLDEARLLSMMGSVASAGGVLKHAQSHNLAVAMKLEELQIGLVERYKAVRRTGNPGNPGGREDKDAGGAEQEDCDDADGAAHLASREPGRHVFAVRDGAVLLRRGRDEASARAFHSVPQHTLAARQPEHGVPVRRDDQDDGQVVLSNVTEKEAA